MDESRIFVVLEGSGGSTSGATKATRMRRTTNAHRREKLTCSVSTRHSCYMLTARIYLLYVHVLVPTLSTASLPAVCLQVTGIHNLSELPRQHGTPL